VAQAMREERTPLKQGLPELLQPSCRCRWRTPRRRLHPGWFLLLLLLLFLLLSSASSRRCYTSLSPNLDLNLGHRA
jgi:hypothetical protein